MNEKQPNQERKTKQKEKENRIRSYEEGFDLGVDFKEFLKSDQYHKLKEEIYNSVSDIIDQKITAIDIMPLFNVLVNMIEKKFPNGNIP